MKTRHLLGFIPALTLLLSSCNSFRMPYYPDSEKYLIGNQEYDTNIAYLDVHWVSGKVTLIEDIDMNGVKLEENSEGLNDKEKVHSYLDTSSNYLSVKFFESNYYVNNFDSSKKHLTITYNPEELVSVFLKLTSGYIEGDEINASTVSFEITSGKVKVNRINATYFTSEVTSGEVEINELNASEATAHLTSGKFSIEKANVLTFNAKMTSGTTNVKFDALGKGNIEATSGSISVKLPDEGGKVRASKTSGSINVHRENYHIIDGVYTFGTGLSELDIKITSGKIDLY